MGSYIHPFLARQLAAIDGWGFGAELTAAFKERAIRNWQFNNVQDDELFGIDDYPWRKDVQPEEIRA